MALAAVVLYPGGRRHEGPVGPPILTRQGADLRGLLLESSAVADIPAALLLACLLAESGLDSRAERWGTQTTLAKAVIARNDLATLQSIIDATRPDISFGLGQRIVEFHYHGTGQYTLANVLDVRQFVFDHMQEDVRQAALFLRPRLAQAQAGDLMPCDGDVLLGALAAYNAGHFPGPNEPYWQSAHGKAAIANYRSELKIARASFPV